MRFERQLIIVICVSALLAACAGSFTVPITGQLADGTPAAGQATAAMDGHGTFWVQIPRGPRCSGTYNSLDTNPTIQVPVTCDDGRSGDTLITRQLDGISGTAIVTLNDGTRGQFVFGKLTFQQAYGNGAVQTNTTQDVHIVQ